jgi:hypothetical protein
MTMTFDDWWDTTKAAATPETFAGWEQSCRQAWRAGQLAERERCARIVETQDTYGDPVGCWFETLAAKIRA